MSKVSYQQFRQEVEEIYRLRAKGTSCKMRQVLREIGELGITTMADLRPVTVARWVQAHPGRSPCTVESLLRSFKSAVSIGLASGYLTTNPLAVRVVLPEPPPTPKRRHYSIAEVEAILERARQEARRFRSRRRMWRAARLEVLVMIYAFAALRKSEALYLMWEDVDVAQSVIHVHPIKAIKRKLKTHASAAPVPMAPQLVEAIDRWKHRCGILAAAPQPADWLIPNVSRTNAWTGGPPGQKPLCQVGALGQRAGVPGVTILGFRHSFASHAPRWGISREMVQAILRHTTLRTQETYTHADIPDLIDAAARIGYGTQTPPAA
jgi:integrase